MEPLKTVIVGAAGRDFHNFNVLFRQDPSRRVAAFTAAQIPNLEGRTYPPSLAGSLYPEGIPVRSEQDLERMIREEGVREAIFSYSDVSHLLVMRLASRILAWGADFRLIRPVATMLRSTRPVISVGAVRTGAGKSQTTRKVAEALRDLGFQRIVVVRHPMPYGDLARQACQRFAVYEDLDRHRCTIEEREEYEPHLARGFVVYAGVDYERILREAEREAEAILWDGGNNDTPFFQPDLHLVVADPHRPGHEILYFPGLTNLLMADAVIVNKVDTAAPEAVEEVRRNIMEHNPEAEIIEAASPLFVEDPSQIRGKRALVVEDGPTLTHGEMAYGAGVLAARRFGAAELIDPRPYSVGSLQEVYRKYPHIGPLLPAMGYGDQQVRELEATIQAAPAEVVIVATPIDLRRLIRIAQPALRVRYELQEIGAVTLRSFLYHRINRRTTDLPAAETLYPAYANPAYTHPVHAYPEVPPATETSAFPSPGDPGQRFPYPAL